MNLIVKTVFGSHLYGTDTEDSDKDYKGIYMPSMEDIILGRIKKSIVTNTKEGDRSKNTAEDVDIEIYSLQYFIELALEGQTAALDMLHTPSSQAEVTCPIIWYKLQSLRHMFYTKDLKAFTEYCRKQAAKYGVKGSRIAAIKSVISLLYSNHPNSKMLDIWHKLPINEHAYMVENTPNNLRQYQICGKKFQETVKVGYVLPVLEKYMNEYGARAKLAEKNEGIDWKAVSHALRVAYQTRSILVDGDIKFPLQQAEFLRLVKRGKKHYMDEVLPVLEKLMDEVEVLSHSSKLPEEPDREFWENFVVE